MIEINKDDIFEFKKNGFIVKKISISKVNLQNYKKIIKNLHQKFLISNFPYKRMYHDYLFSNNWAAIECPLNKQICDYEVWNFFSKLNLGSSIQKISNFQNIYCKLIRLFVMQNFNYSGNWHQDCDELNKRIQVSIYFKDEKGFKIVKPDMQDDLFKKYFNNERDFLIKKIHSEPLKFDEMYYNTVDAKEGDIIFFDPYLVHQGSYKSSRLQFHMRFDGFKEEKEIFLNKHQLDFFYYSFYDYDFALNSEDTSLPKATKLTPFKGRSSLIRRLANTINYFLPIKNFYRIIRLKKNFIKYKHLKFDFFANTFWQK